MKKTLITLIILATLTLSGCFVSPIKTTLDLETTQDGPSIAYSSEKDIEFTKITRDPDGNILEEIIFKATASDPAIAQAERDKAQAETNKASVDLAKTALEVAGNSIP